MAQPIRAGVLALQGGVVEHVQMLEQLGANVILVRRESDFTGPDGPRLDTLVLPGGESSTQDRLLRLFDLADPLRRLISGGLPTLGTCAGLILLARDVLDPAPGQRTLGVFDASVRRNALGAQLASCEAEFTIQAAGVFGSGAFGDVRGALIRAPEIAAVGPGARVIAVRDGRILGATSFPAGLPSDTTIPGSQLPLGPITGIAFHPEISGDPGFHRALLAQAR